MLTYELQSQNPGASLVFVPSTSVADSLNRTLYGAVNATIGPPVAIVNSTAFKLIAVTTQSLLYPNVQTFQEVGIQLRLSNKKLSSKFDLKSGFLKD